MLREGAVRFDTRDGVDLAADVYRVAGRGERRPPGAVLLHMIPPGNTRSNYSAQFIATLMERGFDVVNVDRRGAGVEREPRRRGGPGPVAVRGARSGRPRDPDVQRAARGHDHRGGLDGRAGGALRRAIGLVERLLPKP